MTKKLLLLFVLFMFSVQTSRAANILGIFPAPATSHYTMGAVILKEMARRGHTVKMVSILNEKSPIENFTTIELTEFKQIISKQINSKHFLSLKDQNAFKMEIQLGFGGYYSTKGIFEDSNFQKLLKSNEQFDVVIVELFIYEALFALSHHYKAPLVGVCLRAPSPWSKDLVGNPIPYSYVPNHLTEFSDKMTFKQRLINTAVGVFSELFRHFIYIPWHNSLVQKFLPNCPPLQEIISNASLVLTNSHPSYSPPMALVPNMVPIGGYHVSKAKKLPEDLKKILDESKQGAIYFSMGGNLKSVDFPENVRNAFVEAFSKINQTVLWKWEGAHLPGKPKNVITKSWFPQADVLAHPNVKLFITHGGVLSLIETLDRGVPVICMPIFGDQRLSAMEAVNKGYGILLEFDSVTAEKITLALNEGLYNPKLTNNVRTKSEQLRDQQVHPLDKAVWSIEYVIRHKGAKHLRVASLDLNLFQYFLFDVIAFILFVLFAIFYLFKLMFFKTKINKIKQS